MTIERIFEMPSKWTFRMRKVREHVESRIEGHTLNLFGGATRLNGDVIHNDINPDLSPDISIDAYDLDKWVGHEHSFDTVIFDPPFTAHQAVVTYGLKKAQKVTHARDVVDYVLRPGGRVISLGYNSTGMGESRGYSKEDILLVNHGGSHNDMIILTERKNVTG